MYKKYWQAGFATRLYDLLAPEAYLDSLRLGVECAPAGEGRVWLDAGCGSGLALRFLDGAAPGKRPEAMPPRAGAEAETSAAMRRPGHPAPGRSLAGRRGDRYVGIDLLAQGLSASLAKAKALGLEKSVLAVRADLSFVLPLKEKSVDIVFAHFVMHVFGGAGRRMRVLNGFHRVLKPGGTLILTCPSRSYDPENIVRASLASAGERYGIVRWLIGRWICYPLALALGLRHVENQLKTGVWHGYALDELKAEVQAAGFEVYRAEPVYADSACLVQARVR